MEIHHALEQGTESALAGSNAAWTPPRFEVISLDCEITSYAPDGDAPLF